MHYGFDDFDEVVRIGNRHGHMTVVEQPEDEYEELTAREREFVKGTIFGICVGIGLVLLTMVIMACI